MSSLSRRISCAAGREKSDLVLKNAKIVDVFCQKIIESDVAVAEGRTVGLGDYQGRQEIDCSGKYVMPSFFDTHIHFESSMLTPNEYVRIAAPKGVTTLNCDTHEIANVCGEEGIKYMIECAKGLPVDINFMLPSCVPSTPFDHSNAVLDAKTLAELKLKYNFLGLAEMMNYVGVVNGDKDVGAKLELFDFCDGHSPRLSGKQLNAYLCGGIYTDHEAECVDEVLEKISKGMYIMIREGSQTKTLKALINAVNPYTLRRLIFCTDDRYAGDILLSGSISNCIHLAVDSGIAPIDAIKMASLNAYECYGIKNRGAVAPNFHADLVVSEDITAQKISYVFKAGKMIAKEGKALFDTNRNVDASKVTNTVNIRPLKVSDLEMKFDENIPVIQVMPDTVVTNKVYKKSAEGLNMCANIERHKATGNIGKCFVEGFGLAGGAIAQTIGHDSHNITVLGDNAADMVKAVEALGKGGGMSLVIKGEVKYVFPLAIAGLMSEFGAEKTDRMHGELLQAAKALNINPKIEPFMLLSFLSLIVIPEIKISDSGLFDVTTFSFIK